MMPGAGGLHLLRPVRGLALRIRMPRAVTLEFQALTDKPSPSLGTILVINTFSQGEPEGKNKNAKKTKKLFWARIKMYYLRLYLL